MEKNRKIMVLNLLLSFFFFKRTWTYWLTPFRKAYSPFYFCHPYLLKPNTVSRKAISLSNSDANRHKTVMSRWIFQSCMDESSTFPHQIPLKKKNKSLRGGRMHEQRRDGFSLLHLILTDQLHRGLKSIHRFYCKLYPTERSDSTLYLFLKRFVNATMLCKSLWQGLNEFIWEERRQGVKDKKETNARKE